ncbi:MAG TPA: isoprenylcysteine carboxylmethyltransferase family protein [Terriglobales bacterium]|nr:isoprenylcysteine carboxylmethyltransferase family protein [Terriglobales bacterium]
MRQIQTDNVGLTALILVVLSWVAFALIFAFRKKVPKAPEAKRDSSSKWGIVLQACAITLVWAIPRAHWWPVSGWLGAEVTLAAVAVALAYLSSWLCYRAVQTLGKQWTYAARVVEGHELITQGPYAVVRNPIYLGMFGVMFSTGLVFSTWWALLLASVLFLVGNHIRIQAEEKLLRETFGSKFDEYVRNVPAMFPRLW